MKTETLKIAGMSCSGCTHKLTHALQAVSGVSEVKVSLQPGEAIVQYYSQLTSPEQLEEAVKRAGYSVNVIDSNQQAESKGDCGCGCS